MTTATRSNQAFMTSVNLDVVFMAMSAFLRSGPFQVRQCTEGVSEIMEQKRLAKIRLHHEGAIALKLDCGAKLRFEVRDDDPRFSPQIEVRGNQLRIHHWPEEFHGWDQDVIFELETRPIPQDADQ